jgi:hypothetical protein
MSFNKKKYIILLRLSTKNILKNNLHFQTDT